MRRLDADAEHFLTDLLDASPGRHRASAKWHFLRGVARQGLGAQATRPEAWDSALADYRAAVVDPNLAGAALNNAGKITEALGRFGDAVTLYRLASRQRYPHPLFAFNLGRVFEHLGEPDSALAGYGASLAASAWRPGARRSP